MEREEAMSFALGWMSRFARAFDDAADELGELDRKAGDGDFALNMGSALRKMDKALAAQEEPSDAEVLTAASEAFLDTGGTSGPLLGMWFRELSRACHGSCDVESSAHGLQEGVAAVRRLGGAELGDKTMVDAMQPAADAMREAVADSRSLPEALSEAAAAAGRGADGTASMDARLGRASYVGEAAEGLVDPGAAAVALMVRCASEEACA